MKALALVFVLACSSSSPPDHDVVGPFTGDVHRFVVDAITLPTSTSIARQVGDDVNGDGVVDNQAGSIMVSLQSFGDGNAHASDMIAAGVIASSVELQADNLDDDDAASVTFFGAPGDPATLVGGKLVGGAFEPNRTAHTHVPGEAIVHIPVFADADPLAVHVVGLELFLTPDGNGGFDARIAGGVRASDVGAIMVAGILQMVLANPHDHLELARGIDTTQDGTLTRDEILRAPLVLSLTAPDVQLFDGDSFAPNPSSSAKPDSLSFAIAVHLRPCDAGSCITSAPTDRCHDRILDGNETEIDCGGSCQACPGGARCTQPTDCETGACDSGHCRAPTCSDGAANGFESDIDCGDNCPACGSGKLCYTDADCAAHKCDGGLFGGGRCH